MRLFAQGTMPSGRNSPRPLRRDRPARARDAAGTRLNLKKLTAADSKDVWKWRNDPATRKNSTVRRRIAWKEHQRWFRKVLKGRRHHLFLVTQKKSKLGMIRFDVRSKRMLEISINMNPEFRGQGFGQKSLRLACRRMKKRFPNHLQKAVIRKKNKASEKIFSRAGFLPAQALDKSGRWLWVRR